MSEYNFIDNGNRKTTLNAIDGLRKQVSEINLKILDSLEERRYALESIEDLFSSIGSSEYFFGTEYSRLESEWDSLHFRSILVKKAVATVRKYLFCDTSEEFRSFGCTGLQFESYYNGGCRSNVRSVSFTFTNGTYVFSVTFPSITSRTWHDGYYRTSDYFNKEILPENKWLGKIRVSVNVNEYLTNTIMSSAKFEEVRETIFELVHNFKETIDKKLLEESNKYVEYKVIGRQYMYEEESNLPSEPRSDSLGDMLEYFGYV